MADAVVDTSSADLESGFDDEEVAQHKADAVPETQSNEPVEVPKKYVQLSEDDFKRFTETVEGVHSLKAEMQKSFGTAFGKMGFLETTLKQLQAATPAGYAVEVTDDVVADMAQEFPELAESNLKAFKAFAGKLKGTGQAAAPAFDPKLVDSHVQAEVVKLQIEALEDEFPTWREIVGEQNSKNDYRQWLATQDEGYQKKLNSTNSAAVIAKSISKFNEAKAAANAKAAATQRSTRQDRIRDAITPRGDGGNAGTSSNPLDELEAGFATG